MYGRGSGFCGFVGRADVGRADMYMKDGLHLTGKGQQYWRMD